MPLTSQPPLLEVMEQLPPLGSAVPVIIERDNVPPMLPAVGAWVKLKVVGLLAVQVSMLACQTSHVQRHTLAQGQAVHVGGSNQLVMKQWPPHK